MSKTTKVISYSEIDAYRQCALKHQLAYQERWAGGAESEALERGTLFHLVMETHYGVLKDGGTDGDARTAVKRLLWDPEAGAQTDRQELVEWMYDGYTAYYNASTEPAITDTGTWGTQADADWDIVGIEVPLEAWIYNDAGNRTTFKMAGTCDLLVRDRSAGNTLWIVDHKTCRTMPKQKDFDFEDQTAIYTYLMRQNGYDVRGAIYNHCRTEKLKRDMTLAERFKRTLTVRQPEELKRMTIEALGEMQEAYRRPAGTTARRTPDGERCGWKCGFTEPCLAARKGGNLQELMAGFGFAVQETKPGPTFKKRAAEGKVAK